MGGQERKAAFVQCAKLRRSDRAHDLKCAYSVERQSISPGFGDYKNKHFLQKNYNSEFEDQLKPKPSITVQMTELHR